VSDGFSGAHLDLMDGRADLPRFGAVIKGPSLSLPYVVTDAAGREVEPVSGYLRDLQLSDASPLTCRSYGYDLLRWFRLLWAVDVGWEQATEREAAALVGWLRAAQNPQRKRSRPGGYPAGSVNPKTGKPVPASGYTPATTAHNLTVVHGFYEFHRHFGRGPVVNPVPESRSRRRALAHVSPIEAPGKFRRGRLRPKVQPRPIRAIPDAQWDELFARMGCNRDRALLACWVSSGARAEELLGVGLGDIDWQAGKLWVVPRARGCGRRFPCRRRPWPTWPPTSTRRACRTEAGRSGGHGAAGPGR
jgi:integrase